MTQSSKIKKNVTISFFNQIILLVLGFVVPRIFIKNYGSDTNGLISTVNQIFVYMALLEAGVAEATQNALYKPLTEHDDSKISNIYSVAVSYFRRITRWYGLGVIALSIIVPLIVKSNVDKTTIFFVVFFQGIANVISFYYVEANVAVLKVFGEGYITNEINTLSQLLGYVSRIILAIMGINVAFVQFSYCLINVLKVFLYKKYFKKHYSWIVIRKTSKDEQLKDRNSYVLTNVAWTIFSSTDMIVLSMFVSTSLASVYSLYNMVYSSINVLLNSIYTSTTFLLGQTFHENIDKYKKVHDAYNSVFVGGMTIFASTAYVLIIPFVQLYTNGIQDVNYIYKSLPVLFSLVQIISWSRYVSGNLTGVAGYARSTSYISLIEALMNVTLSIILVFKYSITGVLLATVVSLPLKVIWCTYIADKKVMHRSYFKSISILGCNYFLFALIVLISNMIKINIVSILDFIIKSMFVFALILFVGFTLNVIVNPSCLNMIKRIIRSGGKS